MRIKRMIRRARSFVRPDESMTTPTMSKGRMETCAQWTKGGRRQSSHNRGEAPNHSLCTRTRTRSIQNHFRKYLLPRTGTVYTQRPARSSYSAVKKCSVMSCTTRARHDGGVQPPQLQFAQQCSSGMSA